MNSRANRRSWDDEIVKQFSSEGGESRGFDLKVELAERPAYKEESDYGTGRDAQALSCARRFGIV